MFTGIISDIGRIVEISQIPAGLRTRIATAYDPDGIDIGASIACDGVCHTVTAKDRTRMATGLRLNRRPRPSA